MDISKWREDIQEPSTSNLDYLFRSSFASSSLDPFEVKDTVSEHSMDRDSAYQSQSGRSQRGTTKPDENQWIPAFDFSSMNNQFTGNPLTSPMLGSDNSTPFSEQPAFHQTHPSDGLDAPWNTDVSVEQVLLSSFANANATQNMQSMQYDMGYGSWDAPSSASLDPFASYSTQQDAASMFDALSQPQQSAAMMSTSPLTVVPNSSSFGALHRRTSTQSVLRTFGASPTNTVHTQRCEDADQLQTKSESRNNRDEDTGPFLPTPSVHDEDDTLDSLSPGEAKKYEEERTKSARTDPLYQTSPDAEGLYACPFQNETNCSHKKTNLKCNFDKFLDSHIKPFRCKREKCDDVKFSSTACLLRHERENHGMHGHGDRPHLCYYPECDRSRIGHGFPRRYNAFDHMKRVHGWKGDQNNPSSSPKEGTAPGLRKVAGRKRKSMADEGGPKRKAKVSDSKPAEPSHQEILAEQRIHLLRDFATKKQRLVELLGALHSPEDLDVATQDRLQQGMAEMIQAAAAHKECSG